MSMHPLLRDNAAPLLHGKKVLLGITGSIAAFKACDIVRYLRECGAEVRVVLTESAEKFVTPLTLETLSGNPVTSSLWEERATVGTHHISAARWADLILVAPATANTLAKMAMGLADDLLSSEILSFQGPVLVAPAMNPQMWLHAATQANAQTLQSRGIQFCGPVSGKTSCGEEGLGRMLEPEEILQFVAHSFCKPSNGEKALVSLGPTRSAFDPVRYLTNRSSGKMGVALVWALLQEGFAVTAVCGPVNVPMPSTEAFPNLRIIGIQTAEEMQTACLNEWPSASVFISAAAVLDWNAAQFSELKLKKDADGFALNLKKNPDILAELSSKKTSTQFVLGFAAETDKLLENGVQKKQKKNCDAVFINQAHTALEADQNGGYWIGKQNLEISAQKKTELARSLIALMQEERHLKALSAKSTGTTKRTEPAQSAVVKPLAENSHVAH